MSALENQRHERFAQELAKGKSASAAYELAGFKPNSGNATTLKAKQSILKRVQELVAEREQMDREATEKALERLSITKERVLAELGKIAFSEIRNAISWRGNVTVVGEDPDTGEPQTRAFNEVALIDSHKLDAETAGAIAEISQTKEGALKLKFYDKRAALVDLGKHLGLFIDPGVNVNIQNVVNDEPLTDEQWAEQFAEAPRH